MLGRTDRSRTAAAGPGWHRSPAVPAQPQAKHPGLRTASSPSTSPPSPAGGTALGMCRVPCVFMFRPATIKSAFFLHPAVPAVPPSPRPPHARSGPALGRALPAAAAAGPRSALRAPPPPARRRDDDDGAEQDLRAEARQVPAGGGRRVLHDRLRGAARAGAGPGPGNAGAGPGDAGGRAQGGRGAEENPGMGGAALRPRGSPVPPWALPEGLSRAGGTRGTSAPIREAPGTRTGVWGADPPRSQPEAPLRITEENFCAQLLRSLGYFTCGEATNPTPGPLGSGTAPKSGSAAPSALCTACSGNTGRQSFSSPVCAGTVLSRAGRALSLPDKEPYSSKKHWPFSTREAAENRKKCSRSQFDADKGLLAKFNWQLCRFSRD